MSEAGFVERQRKAGADQQTHCRIAVIHQRREQRHAQQRLWGTQGLQGEEVFPSALVCVDRVRIVMETRFAYLSQRGNVVVKVPEGADCSGHGIARIAITSS